MGDPPIGTGGRVRSPGALPPAPCFLTDRLPTREVAGMMAGGATPFIAHKALPGQFFFCFPQTRGHLVSSSSSSPRSSTKPLQSCPSNFLAGLLRSPGGRSSARDPSGLVLSCLTRKALPLRYVLLQSSCARRTAAGLGTAAGERRTRPRGRTAGVLC